MIFIMMSDGTMGQVEAATMAAVEGDELICRDRDGRIVERFNKLSVNAYGRHNAFRDSADEATALSSAEESSAR
jgi:hypothetical protein